LLTDYLALNMMNLLEKIYQFLFLITLKIGIIAISMKLSREDLASRVGTATESVIRTLSEFKKEGLVEIKGSEMKILKPLALAHMKY